MHPSCGSVNTCSLCLKLEFFSVSSKSCLLLNCSVQLQWHVDDPCVLDTVFQTASMFTAGESWIYFIFFAAALCCIRTETFIWLWNPVFVFFSRFLVDMKSLFFVFPHCWRMVAETLMDVDQQHRSQTGRGERISCPSPLKLNTNLQTNPWHSYSCQQMWIFQQQISH